jgi:hypothetical protein
MNNPKATKESASAAEKIEAAASIPAALVTMYQKGVERLFEAQKTALDLAVQHSEDVVESCKKHTPALPGLFLVDLSRQLFARSVETQKSVLNLVLEQTGAAVDFVKQRTELDSKITNQMAGVFEQSLERGLAAQKAVLEFAAQQNKAIGETVQKQAGVSGTPAAAVADSVQKGVDALIETQKELLEIAAKPLKEAASAAKA